jgi:hypothetical protein
MRAPSTHRGAPRPSVPAPAGRTGVRAARLVAAFAVPLMLAGCLGKPGIEDRWTRLDIEGANVMPYQPVTAGTTPTFNLTTKITYRSIITGYAVAELRASTVKPNQVRVEPDAQREPMAYDIDRILANSVSMGRATRAITGWDHLIQRIDFTFAGAVPTGVDSTGSAPGLFLLTYLAAGDEVERLNQPDTLIITPFPSGPYEILPMGMPLAITAPVP